MLRPNFFIVGAPKCGTTALSTYLGRHPEIFMAAMKEAHFFATDLSFRIHKPKDMAAYLALFEGATHQKTVGEASVGYIYSREAPQNIKDFCPDARIIIMLRNPVDMIYSLHSQLYYTGDEGIPDFAEALRAELDRRKGLRLSPTCNMPKEFFCYRTLGKYKEYVERYLRVFPAENINIIDFDQFKKNTAQVFKETCRFLGVDPDVPMTFPMVNENKRPRSPRVANFLRNPPQFVRKTVRALVPRAVRRPVLDRVWRWNTVYEARPPLDSGLRKELSAEFAQDVEDLGRLLGRNFRHWGT